MSVINARFHPQFKLYPGGYRRNDAGEVEFDRDLPQFPALTGVRLRDRYYSEIVHHVQYSAHIVIHNGDEERLLAMRQVAAWGDVIAVISLGDDRLNVLVYDDSTPDYDILRYRWPFGPVIIH